MTPIPGPRPEPAPLPPHHPWVLPSVCRQQVLPEGGVIIVGIDGRHVSGRIVRRFAQLLREAAPSKTPMVHFRGRLFRIGAPGTSTVRLPRCTTSAGSSAARRADS